MPIKVLIVDDSVVTRKMLSDILSEDADIQVSGVAANGKIALSKISVELPDVILLDILMPVMDGMETLVEIRKIYPQITVIMFSALTKENAKITIDALFLGATDYVSKPSEMANFQEVKNCLLKELIPKIKIYGTGIKSNFHSTNVHIKANKPSSIPHKKFRTDGKIDIVAIGGSTGGPNALQEVLEAIPANFPVPIVIVLHMPAFYTDFLSKRLNEKLNINVTEACSGMILRAGYAYIAPGNFHMEIINNKKNNQIRIFHAEAENSCRPAVNILFRSVAKIFKENALALVLTGMGEDGLDGSREIVNNKGQLIVQDEKSSIVWGMPGAIVKAGIPVNILPLSMIGSEINKRVMNTWNRTKKL